MNNIEKKLNKSADALVREKKADILKYCGIKIKEKSGFNKEKLFNALTVVAVVIFLVSFAVICYIPIANNNAHITAETPGSVTDVYTSTHEAFTTTPEKENGVYIYNGFRSAGEPPFPLPAGIPDVKNGYHVYSGTDYACYAKFTENLKDSGFDYDSTGFGDRYYSGFFIREDSIVYVNYDKEIEELEIFWYKKSPYAPENGVSEDEAVQILYPEKSSSKLELHPLDITPEGFYEKTGAQIFVAPTFSFDRYDKTGHPEMKMAENKHYFDCVTLIKDGKSFTVDYDCIASADIDGDGKGEICILNYGITSGVFTFGFCALTDKDPYSGYFRCIHMRLSFAEKDGELKVCGTLKNDETMYYDIKIEKSWGKEYINLYSDGKPLSNWSVPQVSSMKNEEYISIDEAIQRLESGENVYIKDIANIDDPVIGIWTGDNIAQEFRSAKDILLYESSVTQTLIALDSFTGFKTVSNGQSSYVYKIELENGKYLVAGEFNESLPSLFDHKFFDAAKEITDAPFPSPENSRVVAIIEKCGYDAEAKNPGSNIADADKKSASIIEAADALAAGHSVRLSDIRLPGDATLFASALIADPEKGEQLKNKNGLVILDEFTAKEFRESTDGNVLAAEIGVIYNENGYDKKAMIYAYLPTEALDDCLKVNAETISESSFVSKYADQAAVYSITDYRNNRVLFYDDSIISSSSERMAQ